MIARRTFKDYILYKEGKENFSDPHVVSPETPLKVPKGLERLSEAFKKSKEVKVGKEIDPKAGGEKDVTLKSKKLFLVGGAVRDYMLGHTPKDYNLVTDAHPEEVEKIVLAARPPIHIVKSDRKKGVIKVSVDGETYEIETMRKGNDDQGNTQFTTNHAEDTERRDFTINSLYYDLAAKKIMDFNGGIRHLQSGEVKFIGKPEKSLQDDNSRAFRYARMVNKLPNGKHDDEVASAIGKTDMSEMPPEKIRDEFWKGMEDWHTNADTYLKRYNKLGLLQHVFPGLELSMEFPTCKTCKSRPIVIASLLKNNRPQKIVEKLRELKYTDREIRDAVYLINLLIFSPEHIHQYKRELLRTSLTRRQMLDWVKSNGLDAEIVDQISGTNQSRPSHSE